MNNNFNEKNLQIVKALVKTKGFENATQYIAETLRVQKINGNKNMIAVWESNMSALNSIES
jgi:hypothetical protein